MASATAISPHRPVDTAWLAWFALNTAAILAVDAVPHYPAWLWATPGAPLSALGTLRTAYTSRYHDPLVTGERDAAYVPLLLALELAVLLPADAYGAWRLATRRARGLGTAGADELLFLANALHVALSTAVVVADTWWWDPDVWSEAEKNVFRTQIYGPWVVIPLIMFADMYSRLYRRVTADGETAKAKAKAKTQ